MYEQHKLTRTHQHFELQYKSQKIRNMLEIIPCITKKKKNLNQFRQNPTRFSRCGNVFDQFFENNIKKKKKGKNSAGW